MSAASPLTRFVASVPWPWLAAIAVITLLSLGSYAGVQQVLRSGANDPQVQVAEDTAARLAAGEDRSAVLPAGHLDIGRSLATWVALARVGPGVLAASGQLDGALPQPPAGVLAYAARRGGNRVTWMPRPDVRIALVVVPVPGREGLVVLAGRSLREVEARVDRIGRIFLLAWAGSAAVVGCAGALAAWAHSRARPA